MKGLIFFGELWCMKPKPSQEYFRKQAEFILLINLTRLDTK